MRVAYDIKRKAVYEYLLRNCVGWDRRRLSDAIRAHLRKMGVVVGRVQFWEICNDLFMNTDDCLVGSDDHPTKGGYYIICTPTEMFVNIKSWRKRVAGGLGRINRGLSVLRKRWPNAVVQPELFAGTHPGVR